MRVSRQFWLYFAFGFMLLFTVRGALAIDSTNPADYFFYDNMEDNGEFLTHYSNDALWSYSTSEAYQGTQSLFRDGDSGVGITTYILQSAFDSAEYSNPFCVDMRYYLIQLGGSGNRQQGVWWDRDGTWFRGYLMFDDSTGGLTQDMGFSNTTSQYQRLQEAQPAAQWNYLRFCVYEGFATSGSSNISIWNTSSTGAPNYNNAIDRNILNRTNFIDRDPSGGMYIDMLRIWNLTEHGTNPPQATSLIITASLSNRVNGTSVGSVTFQNVTGVLTFDYYNITSTGFCVTYTGNGSETNCTAGSGASTFLNVSNTSTITASQSVTASTFQGYIDLEAYQLYTGTQINSYTGYNGILSGSTTNGTLLLPANSGAGNNVSVDVAGNYSKSGTCNVFFSSLGDTETCRFGGAEQIGVASAGGGVFDNFFTIGGNFNGVGISNFTANATNASLITGYNISTTNGSVVYPLLQGYDYYFFMDAPTYAYANVTLSANASTNLYNFTLQRSETIEAYVRDEITRALLNNATFTIELISADSAQNFSETDGIFNISFLVPNNYTIRYKSDDYPERDYYLTVSTQSYANLTLYALTFNESSDVLVTVKDNEGSSVEGAIVKLLRYYVYCNCYEVVEMSETSYSGLAYFNGQYYEGHYKWAVDYRGVNYFISTTPENLVPAEGDTIVTRTITINLGEDYYAVYNAITSTGVACTYNSTTGGLSFTWSGSTVTQGCLDAEYVNGTKYTSVGESCQSASTGGVVLNLNTSKNYKYQGVVTIDGDEIVVCSGWVDKAAAYDFGNNGIFLSAGILITLVLAFSYSATGVLVITSVGIVLINYFGFMTFSTSFISGLAVLVLGLGVYVMRS